MRLKRVRIFGFKTFAERTEFDLDGGIVAVVGPNGCGKSNLVDAMLWGLGEGNARQLRAQSSQDVIFSGSSRRKPLGYAQVDLLFDNEDGALPIDSSEVSITRKLNRAGESEYSINRQNCRLRDIFDLLADSGLGRAGYAIVGQKEIDQALAASAEDRRAWIDEAAGVQRYRSRKVESLRRLASATASLERVGDILREIEDQREPLRREAEVARRYKTLAESLRSVETGLLVVEVAQAVAGLEDLEARLSESSRRAGEESSRADALEVEVRQTGERISELEREMDSVRGLQQGSLTALERADAAVQLGAQRLQGLDELEQNLGEEAEDAKRRLAETQQELDAHAAEERLESENLDRVRLECAGAGDDAKALQASLRELEAKLQTARTAMAEHLRADAERRHQEARRKEIQRELTGLAESMQPLEEGVAEATGAHDERNAAVQELEASIAAVRRELAEMEAQESREAGETRRKLAERAALDGRRRGIEATIESHEGLNQGARAVLEAAERDLLPREYVPVAEAIEADRELAVAIETALGGAANDLIVPDDSYARDAIGFLREHRAGRATFQPITLMRPHTEPPELRRLLNERGVLGIASHLVRCRSEHRPVIDSLLGRILIVEDLDTSLRLAKTSGWSRMVTLDGEVVHSSGAVTGGHASKAAYGMVQRKADLAEILREIDGMDRAVAQAEAASANRSKERERLQGQVGVLQGQVLEARDEAEEARVWLQSLQDELSSARKSESKLRHELETLAPKAAAAEAPDIAALERERDELLRQVAARSADAEIAQTRMTEAEARLAQAQHRVYIASRKLRHAEETEEARARKRTHLGPEREKVRRDIETAEAERQRAIVAKADADARLENAQERKRELLEKSLKLTEEAKSARDNARAVADAAHQAELNRARLDAKRATSAQRLFEEYGISEEDAIEQAATVEVPSDAATLVSRLRRDLRAMGDVNLGAIDAFERLDDRCRELTAQHEDITLGIKEVESSVRELDRLTRERFLGTFAAVQSAFAETFAKVFGGGEGALSLSTPDNVLESGIEIDVVLPGKKRQRLELLSGGERSLCGVAFLFALLKVKPSPLVVLDEVDAPLDGRNVERFVELLQDFSAITQFIVITHNPTTIEAAPVWLGVTMQEPGVSTLAPVRLPFASEAQREPTTNQTVQMTT